MVEKEHCDREVKSNTMQCPDQGFFLDEEHRQSYEENKAKVTWVTKEDIVEVLDGQLNTDVWLIPFSLFHTLLEKHLRRRVYDLEVFMRRKELIKEVRGETAAPTVEELFHIMDLSKKMFDKDQVPVLSFLMEVFPENWRKLVVDMIELLEEKGEGDVLSFMYRTIKLHAFLLVHRFHDDTNEQKGEIDFGWLPEHFSQEEALTLMKDMPSMLRTEGVAFTTDYFRSMCIAHILDAGLERLMKEIEFLRAVQEYRNRMELGARYW